jgi:hypothetical protein
LTGAADIKDGVGNRANDPINRVTICGDDDS